MMLLGKRYTDKVHDISGIKTTRVMLALPVYTLFFFLKDICTLVLRGGYRFS
jgi:hypothetical protein